MSEDAPAVSIGTTVYTNDGEAIGQIRGFDEDGFYVATVEGIKALSVEHGRSGHEYGEAELLWRCSTCGELGDVESLPETCPNCGAPREDLYYWTED